MKIIVRLKKEAEEKIAIDDIEPGIVFKYDNGVVGLKLQEEKVLLLKYSSGNGWLKISDGSMDYCDIEILGRLDEIVMV